MYGVVTCSGNFATHILSSYKNTKENVACYFLLSSQELKNVHKTTQLNLKLNFLLKEDKRVQYALKQNVIVENFRGSLASATENMLEANNTYHM